MPRKFWTVGTDGVHRMAVTRVGETVPWATATLAPAGWAWDSRSQRVAFWRLIVRKGEKTLFEVSDIKTWQAGRAKARQVLEQHQKEV